MASAFLQKSVLTQVKEWLLVTLGILIYMVHVPDSQ